MTQAMDTTGGADQAPQPVRDAFVPAGGRIVVGFDGSAASLQALRTAAGIAELTGATIDAIAVWELVYTYEYAGSAENLHAPAEVLRAKLGAAVTAVFGEPHPSGVHAELRSGVPAKQILQRAEGASLLVLGSRGHGALAGLLLGSVSAKCASAAQCPVLIVHQPATE